MEELKKLEGTWKPTSHESRGEKTPDGQIVSEAMLHITGDGFVVKMPNLASARCRESPA